MVRPRNVNTQGEIAQSADWEQETFDSHTQIKKAAHAVTELGEQLAALSDTARAQFDLPEEIEQAVVALRSMKKGPAIKRQRQYLGKLLRQNEAYLPQIKQTFVALEQAAHRQQHWLETLAQWRDRLIGEGDTALASLLEAHPQLDRTHVRQLMRNAQQQTKQGRPPKASRQLYRYLKQTLADETQHFR